MQVSECRKIRYDVKCYKGWQVSNTNLFKKKKKAKSTSALLVLFFCVVVPAFLLFSVLDLNAFERQNKAEGLGMATDESSGTVFKWGKKSIAVNPCHSRRASCEIDGLEHTLNSQSNFLFSSFFEHSLTRFMNLTPLLFFFPLTFFCPSFSQEKR